MDLISEHPVAPLAWVPWVPGSPSIFEQWVPEAIDFGKKRLQFTLLISEQKQDVVVTRP